MTGQPQEERSPVDLSDVASESPESSTAAEQGAVDSEHFDDTGDVVPPDKAQ